MTERVWPVNRARALLLRKAAEFVEKGNGDDADRLVRVALSADDDDVCDETCFRCFVATHDFDIDQDAAVAEVYGNTTPGGAIPPDPQLPTALQPAEEIAREWLHDPADDGTMASIVSLITRIRAESQPRIAELEAAGKEAHRALAEKAEAAEQAAAKARQSGHNKKAAFHDGRHEAYRDAIRVANGDVKAERASVATGYTRAELATAVDKAHSYIHSAEADLAADGVVRPADLHWAHEALHRVGAGLPRVGCATRDPEAQAAVRELIERGQREIPCGHKVEDLISGTDPATKRRLVTKCGACLAERHKEREQQ